MRAGPDGRVRRYADPGLLTGAAGVPLALLAAITPLETGWDGFLILAPGAVGSCGDA